MLDELREVMAELFGVSPDAITMESRLNSPEAWDSVGHLNLMLWFEREKNLAIDEATIIQCSSVRGILARFEDRRSEAYNAH